MSQTFFNWYRIFNLDDFEENNLVSQKLRFNFLGVGQKDILITKGNETSILVDDRFLIINFNGNNPYMFKDRAVYINDNNDVFVGFPI